MRLKYAFLASLAAIILGVGGVIAGADSMVWLLLLGVPSLVITGLVWLATKLAGASARASAQSVASTATGTSLPAAADASAPRAAMPMRQIGAALAAILLVGVLGIVVWYQVNKEELAAKAAANEQARRQAEEAAEQARQAAARAAARYTVRDGGAYACSRIELMVEAQQVIDAHGYDAGGEYLSRFCTFVPAGVKVDVRLQVESAGIAETDRGYIPMSALRR